MGKTRTAILYDLKTSGLATRHLDYIYAEGRVVALHVKNGNADSLYDPVIGRFFSPDPFVQAPDFTQNFKIKTYKL